MKMYTYSALVLAVSVFSTFEAAAKCQTYGINSVLDAKICQGGGSYSLAVSAAGVRVYKATFDDHYVNEQGETETDNSHIHFIILASGAIPVPTNHRIRILNSNRNDNSSIFRVKGDTILKNAHGTYLKISNVEFLILVIYFTHAGIAMIGNILVDSELSCAV
jgi:hypothetical protein